jgi:hypothetical protein
MLDIRRWSLVRVAVTSLAWILLVLALFVGYVALQVFIVTRTTHADGIGAGSMGVTINGWLAVAVLFAPPLVLTALWMVTRRSALPRSG